MESFGIVKFRCLKYEDKTERYDGGMTRETGRQKRAKPRKHFKTGGAIY